MMDLLLMVSFYLDQPEIEPSESYNFNYLDFAMKLELRNGLDDQAINSIANAVVKEVSDYITSIATTLPNSAPFVRAVVSAIQEFDALQEFLNKEGRHIKSLKGIHN